MNARKRAVLLLPFAAIVACQPSASSTTTPPAAPRWSCDQPIVDLGDMWEAKVVPISFEVRNIGNAVLHLSELKSSCHCTAAKDWPREIQPGVKGVISATFNSQNMSGSVTRTLEVSNDDPTQPLARLTVKANVKTLVTLDPKSGGSFATVKSDQALHRVVRMQSNLTTPLSLELLPGPYRGIFRAEFKESAPGTQFELTIDAKPPIPEGTSSAELHFKTNSPDVPLYKMIVSAHVQPRLAVNPSKVVINPPSPKEKVRQLQLVNNGPTPVRVLSIASSEPRLAIRLLPPDPKKPKNSTIEFTVPANYQPPPYAEAIEIRTDDAEKPVFLIPVQPSFATPKPRPADRPWF